MHSENLATATPSRARWWRPLVAAISRVLLLPFLASTVAAQCLDNWTAAELTASYVSGLAVFDDGSGPRLFASGYALAAVAGPDLGQVAAWNGTHWAPTGDFAGGGTVRLHTITLNGSPGLYATNASAADGVLKWDGATWTPVGGYTGPMFSLVAFDPGGGETLFASSTALVRKFDGAGWTIIGNSSAFHAPTALEVYDDGNGAALYFGGFFSSVSGTVASGIAKWNGLNWSDVGGGVSGGNYPGPGVHALAVYQGKLYAAGVFSKAGSVYVGNIAAWDGTSWSAIGNAWDPGKRVYRLRVLDDGHGEALYAVGEFFHMAWVLALNIARWDGVSWSPVGSGIAMSDNDPLQDVAYFAGGGDAALFACGKIVNLGNSNTTNGVARYWCVCADLTGDGFVGQDDLAVLLAAFGMSPGGDIDKDGDTDQADLGVLLQQYGTACDR